MPLGEDRLVLVASASYLKQMGTPKNFDDFKNHRFLVMGDSPNFDHWTLVGPNDRRETLATNARTHGLGRLLVQESFLLALSHDIVAVQGKMALYGLDEVFAGE